MKKILLLTLLAVTMLNGPMAVAQERKPDGNLPKWEGLADKPQMGWSSWNKFHGIGFGV